MKKKLHKKNTNTNYSRSNFLLAIEQVENYVTEINPQNYSDIKAATKNISKASIGAYLSVHSVKETLEFINQLAHSMVNDISDDINIPEDYKKTIH